MIQFKKIASGAAATPASTHLGLFARSDGKLCIKDSTGAVVEVGAGTGTGTGTVSIDEFIDISSAPVPAGFPVPGTDRVQLYLDNVNTPGQTVIMMRISPTETRQLTPAVAAPPGSVFNTLKLNKIQGSFSGAVPDIYPVTDEQAAIYFDDQTEELKYYTTAGEKTIMPADAVNSLILSVLDTNFLSLFNQKIRSAAGINFINSGGNLYIAAAGTNNPPSYNSGTIPQDVFANEGLPFTWQVPADAFTDLDGDTLSYAVFAQGGGSVPSWLSFIPATRTLQGTPPFNASGFYSFYVEASDGRGGVGQSLTIFLTVFNVNGAPMVAATIPDQTAAINSLFSFTFDAGTFVDPDAESLTYTHTVVPSSPSWLSFNGATRTFSGTPLTGDEGGLTVTVRAEDAAGAFITTSFVLTVSAVSSLGANVYKPTDFDAIETYDGFIYKYTE